MPAKTKVTDLNSKYGAEGVKAVANHANDPVKEGFIQLPAGINGGVARLQECYFGEYEKDSPAMGTKKGDYYFRASGVVEEPEYHNGVKIRGLHTSISLPYCPTKKQSMDESAEKVIQELKRLAGDKVKIGDPNSLVVIAAALEAGKPYFRFSTSERKAQADSPDGKVKAGQVTGVWENWHGIRGLENFKPSAGGMKDNTTAAPPPSANGTGHTEAPANRLPDQSTTATGGESQYDELMELAVKAPHDDAAEDELRRLAKEAGYTDAEIDAAPKWEAVVTDMIRKPRGASSTAEAAEVGGGEEEYEPQKGDKVMYVPTGKKRAVKCAVAKVSAKASTADLVSDDGKKSEYKAVPWAELTKAD